MSYRSFGIPLHIFYLYDLIIITVVFTSHEQMTSTTQRKLPCAKCSKTSGLFMCRGCGKDFCMHHANEHRQELGKQLDELTLEHDQFREKLIEETTKPQSYSHVRQLIDQWEQQSIDKIYQAANDVRKKLKNMIERHSAKLNNSLTKIAHEINEARREDEYFETDIQDWVKQLNKLKNDLLKPPTFRIQESDSISPFISKIYIDALLDDVFEKTIGNIRLEENDRVIVHGKSDGYATVRGIGEYSYGQHRLRLKIEEYHSSKWIFIGIISKDIFMEEYSVNSPSVYGWAGPNQVYINGVYHAGFKNYQSDLQKDDILELLIDCDERKISLINGRTRSSCELDIDLNKCPFPWQLNITMYFFDDRIRFLST